MAIETKTKDEFEVFLRFASRGEQAIYHIGYLVEDSSYASGPSIILRDLKAAARRASEQGLAMLTQRKIGPKLYEYRATRM